MFHVGATGCQRDLSPGISKSVGAGAGTYHPTEQPEPSMEIVHHVKLLKGPRSDGASEKIRDLSPSQPGEQQTDVALEGWKGSAESILLFVRVSVSYALRTIPCGGPDHPPSTVQSIFHDGLAVCHRKLQEAVARRGRRGRRLVRPGVPPGWNPGRPVPRTVIIITTSRAGP